VSSILPPTKGLILKDFALEPDETKLIKSAHMVISNFSKSFCAVVAKDPLRSNLIKHLEEVVHNERLDDLMKGTLKDVVMNNLNLGANLIKKLVQERASLELDRDPDILEARQRRREAKEKGVLYYEEDAVSVSQTLPEALRANLKGLTSDQLRIYEDFER
jgi:CCR4-NOT transcription complex subunit 1